jgi:hypothetical protein
VYLPGSNYSGSLIPPSQTLCEIRPVIHVVILQGKPADVAMGDAVILTTQKADGEGWAKLNTGAWLIQTDAAPSVWRDHLRERLPSVQILVARLSGTWATMSFKQQADWLKGLHGTF